jgi:hypothetical protein
MWFLLLNDPTSLPPPVPPPPRRWRPSRPAYPAPPAPLPPPPASPPPHGRRPRPSRRCRAISRDRYEAAALDGASRWKQTPRLTLPLLGRTTTLVVALQVIASLKIFDQI